MSDRTIGPDGRDEFVKHETRVEYRLKLSAPLTIEQASWFEDINYVWISHPTKALPSIQAKVITTEVIYESDDPRSCGSVGNDGRK